MLVNEAFTRAYVRDGRPAVGRRIKGLLGKSESTFEIIGVVGDVLKDGLDTKPQPEIYLALNTLDQEHAITREINVVIRTTGDPSAIASTLRSMVRDIEPTAALGHVGTLSSQVADSVSEPRFSTAVLGAFAILALGIAVTGLYGVLSYNVSQRRKEIGIRSALGATRADLVGLVVRQGLTITLLGLGAGVVIAVSGRAPAAAATLRHRAARSAILRRHAGHPADRRGARLRDPGAACGRDRSGDYVEGGIDADADTDARSARLQPRVRLRTQTQSPSFRVRSDAALKRRATGVCATVRVAFGLLALTE